MMQASLRGHLSFIGPQDYVREPPMTAQSVVNLPDLKNTVRICHISTEPKSQASLALIRITKEKPQHVIGKRNTKNFKTSYCEILQR